jgi:hypothetical protein
VSKLNILYLPNLDMVTVNLLNNNFSDLYPQIIWKNKTHNLVLEMVDYDYLRLGDLNGVLNSVLFGAPRYISNYFNSWVRIAIDRGLFTANNPIGNYGQIYHLDALSTIIKSPDHLPTTVVLPDYFPNTIDQQKQILWIKKQQLIARFTQYGWNDERRVTDWNSIELALLQIGKTFDEANRFSVQLNSDELLMDVVNSCFNNKYPINVKIDTGLGYLASSSIDSIKQLFMVYQSSYGQSVYLQEVIEEYTIHVQCIVIGPDLIMTALNAEGAPYERCQPKPITISNALRSRINDYIDLISVYYGLSIYTCEFLVNKNSIYPVGFINIHPDISLSSLNVHYPKAFTSLFTWSCFIGVSQHKRIDETARLELIKILSDADLSVKEKNSFIKSQKKAIYDVEGYEKFRQDNFNDIEYKIKSIIHENIDDILLAALSDIGSIPEDRYSELYAYFKNCFSEHYFNN